MIQGLGVRVPSTYRDSGLLGCRWRFLPVEFFLGIKLFLGIKIRDMLNIGPNGHSLTLFESPTN